MFETLITCLMYDYADTHCEESLCRSVWCDGQRFHWPGTRVQCSQCKDSLQWTSWKPLLRTIFSSQVCKVFFRTHTDVPAGPGRPGRPGSPVNPRAPGGPDWPGCPGCPIWPWWPLCPGSPVDPFWRKHHLSISKARQVSVEQQWLIHLAEHTSPLTPIAPAEPCQSKSGEHYIAAANLEKRHCRKQKKDFFCLQIKSKTFPHVSQLSEFEMSVLSITGNVPVQWCMKQMCFILFW